MDDLTPGQRRRNMRHIHSKDTSIEIKLRKALWHKGYRYRKNYNKLIGKPDIVLAKYHIAIFCDSEFFHGKDWPELKKKILKSNNSEYWYRKIKRNMKRDNEVNRTLNDEGWRVLRLWGKDIKKNLEKCLRVIDEAVLDAKRQYDL